ncbi:MAG: hypothetical protein WAM75_21655 [Xanthobacteraceae bacterium]
MSAARPGRRAACLYPKILVEVRAGGSAKLPPINNLESDMRRDPPGWLR